MAVDYKSIEYSLHESLIQIADAYKLLKLDAGLLEQVQQCKDLLKTKRYTIAVMGEFKRGKSSLINALLGSKILPADATPTTATINRITFAPSPKVVVTYKDGDAEDVDINALGDYVTKLTDEGELRAMRIREATIYFPTQICQNHVDIIDTPGLNDEARMTRITIEMVENVDAVIVPIHARAPFSATEKNFVCQMLESDNIHNIVFVITFIDQLDEDDYEYDSFTGAIKTRIQTEVFAELERRSCDEQIISKAHMILDNISLFAISSSLALKSFVTNNRSDLKKSRFEEFRVGLMHIVTAKQTENALRKSVEQIQTLISEMAPQHERRLNHIKSETDDLERAFLIVSNHGSRAKKLLDDLFADGYDRLELTVSGLNALKNKAFSFFVKRMSEISVNAHDEIKRALTDAASDCVALMNDEGVCRVAQMIMQHLSEDIRPLAAYLRSELFPALSALDASEAADISADMLCYSDEILGRQSFEWTCPVVPSVPDLTCRNVIEDVINAVDHSVTCCIGSMRSVLTDIRENWFACIEEDARKMAVIASGLYQSKHETLDREFKAQLHNFNVSENNANAILERCSELMRAANTIGSL